VELDKFLNRKSISVLQSYYFFWTGSSDPPRSKAQLLRRLRQSMLDRGKLASRFDALGDGQQHLIRSLLSSRDFRRTSAEIADDLGQTIEELDAVGFLDVERTGEDRERIASVGLPADFAVLLAEAADIDLRPAVRLLSLKGFLEGLPDERREELLSEWLGGAPPVSSPVEDLRDPERISQRLQSLGGGLEEKVREAMLKAGGVLAWKVKNQDQTRKALEAALIGTVGGLELAASEFALKGRYLVVFQEIVESFCSSRPSSPGGSVQARGVDFLCDMSALGRACLTGSLRVKRTGEPYAGSRRKLQERMLIRGDSEEEDARLLSWKLSVAAGLGLVGGNAEKTRCRLGSLRDWEQLSLPEKLSKLGDAVSEVPGSTAEALVPETRRVAVATIAEIGGQWADLDAALSRVAAHRLLALCARQTSVGLPSSSRTPRFGEFRMGISDFILHTLWLAGLVETSQAPDGQLVRWAQWHKAQRQEQEKLLLLGPDFELLILSEFPSPHIVYAVERLAVRESVDKVWKYRLTPESVKLAVASGMSSEEIVRFLDSNARKPLPQNVRYSISDWGAKAHLAQGFTSVVFEADSPESLRQAMAVPKFRELVSRELSERVVCLHSELSEEVLQQLREAGVYVDW
jgi:hypothetical protein